MFRREADNARNHSPGVLWPSLSGMSGCRLASYADFMPEEAAMSEVPETPGTPSEPTPAKKPLYKRWWLWVAVAVVVIIIIIASTGGGDSTSGTASPAVTGSTTASPTSSAAAETTEAAATSSPAETTQPPATSAQPPTAATSSPGTTSETKQATTSKAAESSTEPPATTASEDPEAAARAQIAEQYGEFKKIEESGTGDATIKLPAGAKAGMVTASHKGDSNFSVSALDATNESTGDLLVNTIGSYSGVTAFGLSSFGDATKLQVKADGSWKITIVPLSEAPTLALPAKETGDRVYLYLGPAADWSITHKGEGNFAVIQYADFPNLMVNEIGDYKGVVPATTGPTIVTVGADGSWTITEKP